MFVYRFTLVQTFNDNIYSKRWSNFIVFWLPNGRTITTIAYSIIITRFDMKWKIDCKYHVGNMNDFVNQYLACLVHLPSMFGALIFVSYSSATQLYTLHNIHNIFETFLASICNAILVIVFFKYYFFHRKYLFEWLYLRFFDMLPIATI